MAETPGHATKGRPRTTKTSCTSSRALSRMLASKRAAMACAPSRDTAQPRPTLAPLRVLPSMLAERAPPVLG